MTEAQHPYLFDDFIDSGLAEENSPFLKPRARRLAQGLDLKASLLAALFLVMSFILSYFPHLDPVANTLLLAVYVLAGTEALTDSIEDLSNLDVNIDVLMTLAAFSSVLIGSGMEGALLLVLFSISGSMEHTVTQRAKGALSHLKRLAPSTAWVLLEDGKLIQRAVRDLRPGTEILIKAGEVVPLDGEVISGSSSVNLVHLTGESLPVPINVGAEVAAGSRNLEGAVTLKVIKASTDSTLARIIRLVTQAQETRPKLQRWFDRFSKTYATSIIAIAFLVTVSFPFLLGLPWLGMGGSLYRGLSFLIAASPCALILAIPITYLSAVSACARHGILLKGGLSLDALASCTTIAFDKTGTLTTGELSCQGVSSLSDDTIPDWVIGIASAMERNAVHPIAHAILNYADERTIPPAKIWNFKSVPGSGLEAQASTPNGDKNVAIGHPEFISERLNDDEKKLLMDQASTIRETGQALAVLWVSGIAYLFRFQDTPRPEIKQTLQRLGRQGMRLLMLTGDHHASAETIANELGIDEFYADLRPEDKLDAITSLSKDTGLAMIGDGVNDAPALARATTGIAMGQVGSATATEAADIVLLRDNINSLDWLVAKAKTTKRIVKQNLFLALFAIFVASTAALIGAIPLWLAVVMHEGGTVLVGLNGLRLLRS